MIKIETKQLQEGAILAQPVITPLGQLLAPAGSAVTRQLINRMKLYRVEYAKIEGEEPAPQEETPKPVKEAKTYAQESKTHSQKVAGSSEFRTFQIEYVQAIELMKQLYTAAIKDNKPIDSQNFWAVSQICSSPATPSLKCLICFTTCVLWPIRFMRTVSTLHSFHE